MSRPNVCKKWQKTDYFQELHLANLKFTELIVQWNLCIVDTIGTKKVPAFTDFSKIV